MKVERKIALRYLFSRKSNDVITWISRIGAVGIAIGSAALVVALSVFNGFTGLIKDNIEAGSPYYVLRPEKGKTIRVSQAAIDSLSALEGVDAVQAVVEETVGFQYGEEKGLIILRGLQNAYNLSISASAARRYGIRTSLLEEARFFYPSSEGGKKHFRGSMAASLNTWSARPALISEVEGDVAAVSLDKARELLEMEEGECSYLQIECYEMGAQVPDPQRIREIVPGVVVMDRPAQNPEVYKVMWTEKLQISIILFFMVFMLAVNVYASMSMLIKEKQDDMATLRSMGAGPSMLKSIFRNETMLIVSIGLLIGVTAGLVLSWLQLEFGIVTIQGNNLVGVYPVDIQLKDILLCIIGVEAMGLLLSYLNTRNI